jgi:hypothetical protein
MLINGLSFFFFFFFFFALEKKKGWGFTSGAWHRQW